MANKKHKRVFKRGYSQATFNHLWHKIKIEIFHYYIDREFAWLEFCVCMSDIQSSVARCRQSQNIIFQMDSYFFVEKRVKVANT